MTLSRKQQPPAAVIVAIVGVLAVTLAGCVHGDGEQAAGSTPTLSAGASASPAGSIPQSLPASAPTATGCTGTGTTIPAGSYAGTIKATLTTTMHLKLPGASIPNAGGGTESLRGTVKVVSAGGQVTGTITLSGLGLSHVGLPGAAQVHSVDDGELTAKISGLAASPVVAGTLSGEWASLDAPVVNGKGSASSPVRAGLHVTRAACNSISGDVVAMFAQFMTPVAQYLSVSGSGAWTAAKT